MLPLRMSHHCARSLITRLHRSAIKRAYKAGRDTGDENDPLAQAEAALQVLPAPPSPPPPPPSHCPIRPSELATCRTRQAATTTGARPEATRPKQARRSNHCSKILYTHPRFVYVDSSHNLRLRLLPPSAAPPAPFSALRLRDAADAMTALTSRE